MTAPLEFGVLAFSSLIAMVDPIATAPIFVDLTRNSAERRRQTALRACIVAGATLLVFALAGSAIFHFFGITVPAFQIVGGILLTMSGLRALHSSGETISANESADPSVVPLGIPLIAGGGSISTVMMLSGQARMPLHQIALGLAILLAILITFFVLRTAPWVVARLGKSGQEILSRIMALLTAVIGVQFIINGGMTVISELLRKG